MITKIEALNFRCLQYVDQSLNPFQILVGPNASGKTTFLDVVAFLGQLVSEGLDKTIRERSENFVDLVWNRQGKRFELAIEARIPDQLQHQTYDTIRYEIALGLDSETNEIGIYSEKVLLKATEISRQSRIGFLDPDFEPVPETLLTKSTKNSRMIVSKVPGGNDTFKPETQLGTGGREWEPAFKFGPKKSALANLPADETKFPATIWLKNFLTDGVQKFVLNSLLIRNASPTGLGLHFKPDGSNLPWVLSSLEEKEPARKKRWVAHVQTALPDLEGIRVVENPDNRYRYLMLQYRGGLEVPSWMASDGTLRLLALTLPAYIPNFEGVYLIEEPENGIHPIAVETVYQALSSVPKGQILVASHSPVLLSMAEVSDILCFTRSETNGTCITNGDRHPALKEWRGETNLGTLFAGGILG